MERQHHSEGKLVKPLFQGLREIETVILRKQSVDLDGKYNPLSIDTRRDG